MRHFLPVLMAILILFCVAVKTWGAVITIGVSTGYPPYYFEENGELTGLCVEVVNGVAKEINLGVTYKAYPWKRMLSSARNGHVDAIMPLFRTEEREKFLFFDGLGIASETVHFFSRKESSAVYDGNFENFAAHRIGVVTNYSYGEKFDQFEGFDKKFTLNDKHLVEMFKHKRFDIGLGNKYVTLFYAQQEGIGGDIKFLDPPVTDALLYIGFTKMPNHEELAKQFADALGRFKQTDSYSAIMQKYGVLQ